MSVFSNRTVDSPQERALYAGAILDLLGDKDPLNVLRQTPAVIARSIETMSREQLRKAEAPDKWSMVHVLQHLADSDLVWGWRVRLILSQDRPQLTGYDQDLWADRLHYKDADPDEAMAMFALLRRANLQLLDRATPADLKRVGVHAERGEESIEYLIRLYAGHDLLHLRQIDRISAAVA